MNFTERRKQVFDKMDQDSALLLFSGIELLMQLCKYEKNVNFIQKPSGYLSRRLIFMEIYAKLIAVIV